MKSTIALDTISELVGSAVAVTAALQKLRDGTTDEEWEAIIDNPLVDALISACGDVEDCVS
jgi:hypothetical protein